FILLLQQFKPFFYTHYCHHWYNDLALETLVIPRKFEKYLDTTNFYFLATFYILNYFNGFITVFKSLNNFFHAGNPTFFKNRAVANTNVNFAVKNLLGKLQN